MYFKDLKAVIYLIFLYNFIYSVEWEYISSNLNITDIVLNNDKIYASSNGGVLILDKQLQSFYNLDLEDALGPIDFQSIYIDSKQNILLGSSSPIPSIQLFDKNYNYINTVFLNGIEGLNEIVEIIEFNNSIYAIGRGNVL